MNNHHKILIACMPKSGSTYLTSIVAGFPGFEVTSWVPGYGRREQELCYRRLKADEDSFPNSSLVAQHHVRYSGLTGKYIQEFNLKTIVLVRNLYDIIPSLIDHHRLLSVVYPMANVPSDIVEWDFDRAAKFITTMVLPWYLNFFVSWSEQQGQLMVTYEDLIANPINTMREICEILSIEMTEIDIIASIEQAGFMQTRKNIGITGRGEELPELCRNHISEMVSYYNGTDFSKIGICPS